MRIVIVLALLVAPMLASAQAAPKPPVNQPGRYQLFQGNYEFVNIEGETFWNRALFKIDTATGEIFICSGHQVDGQYLSPPQPGKMRQRHDCRPFESELLVPQ